MKRLFTTAVGVATALVVGSADAAAESEAPAGPSESKRALILQILNAAEDDETPVHVTQVYLAQLRPVHRDMVAEVMKTEKDLSDEERAVLLARLEDFDQFAALFSARLPERLDFEAIRSAVFVPLYDQTFDEKELEEVAAFYRSSTGKKVLGVMPAMMEAGMQATFRAAQPVVMEVVGEVLAQQRGDFLEAP